MFMFRGLDTVWKSGKSFSPDLPIDTVRLSLQDLIGYFQPPGDQMEHEDKQNHLRALKNRQNLFQEEVHTHILIIIIAQTHVNNKNKGSIKRKTKGDNGHYNMRKETAIQNQ